MSLRLIVLSAVTALLLGACSGGGGGTSNVPSAQQSSQSTTASGTIAIDLPKVSGSSVARTPAFVSTDTHHAALFVNQGLTPAGSTTSCTSTSCTINWTANLSNGPGTYNLAVELDDGSTICNNNGPAACVAGEGSTQYQLVPGSNGTLSPPMIINGVATHAVVTNVAFANNAETEYFTISGPGGVDITDAPGNGTNSVFDNDGYVTAVIASGATTNATLSYPANSLFPQEWPNPAGVYPVSAACTTPYEAGTFQIGFAPGPPSGDITASELVANQLGYGGTVIGVTGYTLTCDGSGNISISGTGTVNVASVPREK